MASTAAPGLLQRSAGKARENEQADGDPLAVLNDNASAEPLDEHEQDAVIKSLRESNDKSNNMARGLMLVLIGLLELLYLSPIPDYIRGTHPETHMTMFFAAVHLSGTHDDLVRIPSLPIYLALLSIQSVLLAGAAIELLDLMNLRKRDAGHAFPRQPHVFGTAPSWVVPFLSDLRWHPSHVGVRADSPEYRPPHVMATMNPRLLYLCLLAFASLPLPLMTFGAGSFVNAGWFALSSVVLVVVCICEHWIGKVERETRGLTGMKYNYKGA